MPRQFSRRSTCETPRAYRVKDGSGFAQPRRWIAMAIKAPPHGEGLAFRCQGHLANLSVTRDARHALCNMDAVVEEDVIRKPVDPAPFQRSLLRRALYQRLKHGGRREDLGMAGEAGVGGWHSSERRVLHRRMAISTIDPELTGVVSVAEEDRLNRCHTLPIPIARVKIGVGDGTRCQADKDTGQN
jgi:hypothetical protein